MFTTWLRSNRWAAGILTIIRIYVGWSFLTAGWEKLTGPKAFSAAGFLANAVKHPVLSSDKSIEYPTFHAFLQNFALPNVGLFNFMVPWGEFCIGLGLILGVLTTTAAFFGLFLNFTYMLAGTVSSNPWDVLWGIFIVVGGYNAGKFGGDYWVIPWVRKHITKWVSAEVELPSLGSNRTAH